MGRTGISFSWRFLLLFAALEFGVFAQQQPGGTAQPQAPPILMVKTDLDCKLSLDGEASGQLKAGVIKRIPTTISEHLLTAESTDGKDRWEAVVNVDKQQSVVLIPLLKIVAEREAKERQAADLEQEVKTKREQAKEIKEKTQELVQQGEAAKQRKEEIKNHIAALQKQIQAEQAAAQNDSAAAQQTRANAALEPSTTAGALAATALNAAATAKENSAQAHRTRAVQLQSQMIDLNRQLENVSSVVAGPEPSGSPPVPPVPGPGLRITKQGDVIAFTEEGLDSLRKKDGRRYEFLAGPAGTVPTWSVENRFYFKWCSGGWQQRNGEGGDTLYATKCNFGVRDSTGKWKDFKNLWFPFDRVIRLRTVNYDGTAVQTGVDYEIVIAFLGWETNGAPRPFPYLIRPRDDPGVFKSGHADGKR